MSSEKPNTTKTGFLDIIESAATGASGNCNKPAEESFLIVQMVARGVLFIRHGPFTFLLPAVNGKDRVNMTTITFKRSGGFVGKGMRFQLTLDDLPSNDANALLQLVEEAEFFNLPENLIVKFNPDEYQYTITVDAGVICHTVRTNDTTMPGSLRPLVDELSALHTYAQ